MITIRKQHLYLLIALCLLKPDIYAQPTYATECDGIIEELSRRPLDFLVNDILPDERTSDIYLISDEFVQRGNETYQKPVNFGDALAVWNEWIYTTKYQLYGSHPDSYKAGMKVITKAYRLQNNHLVLMDSTIGHADEGGPGPLWYWNKNGVRLPCELMEVFAGYGEKSILINRYNIDNDQPDFEYMIFQEEDTVKRGRLKHPGKQNTYIKATKLIADGILLYSEDNSARQHFLTKYDLEGAFIWEKPINRLSLTTYKKWGGGIHLSRDGELLHISTCGMEEGTLKCTLYTLDAHTGNVLWGYPIKGTDMRILQVLPVGQNIGVITAQLVQDSSSIHTYSFQSSKLEILDRGGALLCRKNLEGGFKLILANYTENKLDVVTDKNILTFKVDNMLR